MSRREAPIVRRIGHSTKSAVRAPALIPALHNMVEEVILNSLDAGAREIEIRLDFRDNQCDLEVRDDGPGIDLANLERLGEWNMSSKRMEYDNSFGFRGEALATISHVRE